jgi:TetR/AcrR family transcriptional repressor of nem operon
MSPTPAPAAHSDTRELILRTARELIQTRSYLGLSFQELADRVGIRKASLYHHFPSKEALGVAVIERSAEQFTQWQARQAGLSPAQQLLAYVTMFRDQIGAGARLCPGGAMSPGWDCIEPGLQQAVQRMHRQHLAWLAEVAQGLQHQDRVPGKGAPDAASASQWPAQWAAQVNAVCQGGLLTARMDGSVNHFDLATAPLVSQLQSLA